MIFVLSGAMYHFRIHLKNNADPVPGNSIFAICSMYTVNCTYKIDLISNDVKEWGGGGCVLWAGLLSLMILRNEEEEDVFSEPDKEESRRRMGIICKDKDPQSNRLETLSVD